MFPLGYSLQTASKLVVIQPRYEPVTDAMVDEGSTVLGPIDMKSNAVFGRPTHIDDADKTLSDTLAPRGPHHARRAPRRIPTIVLSRNKALQQLKVWILSLAPHVRLPLTYKRRKSQGGQDVGANGRPRQQ